ncbi:MAG: flagellar basal body L-ring protein FlgH [Halobacteriovoraceae bacterium]|nr:flagellar basal body L-ring protein FlgH [Halobacteriovoraceae bacterium]
MKILFPLLFLFSCQNYVANMHNQIKKDQQIEKFGTVPKDQRQLNYLRSKIGDARPIKDPISFSISADNDLKPRIDREYKTYKRRYSADEIADNSNGASLWANYSSTSNLFTTSQRRIPGDIVTINVNKSLKEDISRELRKTFPLKKKLVPKSTDTKDPSTKIRQAASASAKKEDEVDTEEAIIVYDKITSKVAEEINDDHILLKGRKEVYFRNEKRLVEIHSLASRNAIGNGNEVMSDKIMETKIFIIK